MAKKKSGEIDTEEKNAKVGQGEETRETSSTPSPEQIQLQEALAKANALIAQLEVANKKASDTGEKKDNTKPLPLTRDSFLRYVAFLKDKKPKIFEKKFEELQKKADKFGVAL